MSVKSFRTVDVALQSHEVDKTTAAASTLQELIATIPRGYQAVLGDHLTKKYRLAHKHANVQSTISLYERHKNENKFPPLIRNAIKEPKLQFAKEFLSATIGSKAPEVFQKEVAEARMLVLKCAIAQKQSELAHLATLIRSDTDAWETSCDTVVQKIAGNSGGSIRKDSTGKLVTTGLPATALQEFSTMRQACATYTFRVLALARASIDRAELQKIAKMQLKEVTDVEMTDVSKEPAVRDIIREELKALRSELSRANGPSLPVKRRGDALTPLREAKTRRRTSTEETSWKERQREEERETEGKEVSIDTYLNQCSREFRPWDPETFPNVYTSLSDSCRIKIGISFLREWEADSLRASKPGVFQFPGVSLPDDIAYMLAVNHKYVLHPRPETHDVSTAKERFARTVRIRWMFRNEPSNKEYIPKFHVSNPFWNPQKASPAIELGLTKAMEVIDDQVGRALATMATKTPRQRNLNWNRAQQFLEEKNFLVKLTDKNLGLAVFTKEWYETEIHKMLAHDQTYQKVDQVDTEQLLGTLMGLVQKWKLPANMTRFIREKTESQMPEFHTIPKVHKTPWALRPIVPSHSWVTSRLSEVVDHLCRPILDKLPWVVNSTKQVLNNLSKIRLEPGKDVWICTGDMVAMYTNINAKQCAATVAGAWRHMLPDSKIPDQTIRQMIRFIMENNYFSFQDTKWKQIDGLAMGTSCAPILANIYAAFWERKHNVMRQPGVLLYNRYIDDILCVFQGTRKELMDFLEKIQLGSLTINWSFSSKKKEFLDVEIMTLPTPHGPTLATRLFKKLMNRHLYIPWSSAHPLHVKKAFVKAELIRFAMVSSEIGYFADARAQFYGNLRRRGYPSEALENWFRQVSYDNRPLFLSSQKETEQHAPLMLSGQYNPVWEYINVEEVMRAARPSWNQEKNLPESLNQPLIRSLSRSTSLFDLLSVWNKTILHPHTQSSEDSGADLGNVRVVSADTASLALQSSGRPPRGVVSRFPGRNSRELVVARIGKKGSD